MLPVPGCCQSLFCLPGEKWVTRGRHCQHCFSSLHGAIWQSLRDAGFHLGEGLFFLQRAWLKDLHFSACLSQRQSHFSAFFCCFFFYLTGTDCFSFQVKSYWYSAGLFLRVNLKSLIPSLLTPNRFSTMRNTPSVPITLEFTFPQHAHAFINTDHTVEIPFSAKLIKAHTDPVQTKTLTSKVGQR